MNDGSIGMILAWNNSEACCDASTILENGAYNCDGNLKVFVGSIVGNGGGGSPLAQDRYISIIYYLSIIFSLFKLSISWLFISSMVPLSISLLDITNPSLDLVRCEGPTRMPQTYQLKLIEQDITNALEFNTLSKSLSIFSF